METLQVLHSRRSIRKYSSEAVSEQEIKVLLDAAMMAPSAGNAQPWHFVVVDAPALLEKVSTLTPYVSMAKQAPLAVVVCAELALEKYPGFWVQDCSAAIQNMMLAACDLGLGTVWTGIYPVEERVKIFSECFSLPEGVVPLGMVVIGRPATPHKEETRFRPERIHRNQWQG